MRRSPTTACEILGEHSVMPYPLWRAMPNRFSTCALSAGCSGAPEEEMMRRFGKLSFCRPFSFA